MFSGGAASWAAAKRVAERHGTESLTLLFCDTLIEDADLYRFLEEAAKNVGGTLVKIADGRTPWQVFRDVRFLGNTRADPCSRILKRELALSWLTNNCDSAHTTVYIGLEVMDEHRAEPTRERYAAAGWRCEFPMLERPYLSRGGIYAWLKAEGLRRPGLYDDGFEHNNCGGGCVKAGQGHFAMLLRTRPHVYARWEREESALRDDLGDVAILRDRTKGTVKPLPLSELRWRIEAVPDNQRELLERSQIGGCGCFTDSPIDAAD